MISVVIDCEEPARLADFWRRVVGGVIDGRTRSAEWVAIEGVPGLAYLAFQRVPEPKLVKNRVHLDISVGDLEPAIQTAIGRGAVAVGSREHVDRRVRHPVTQVGGGAWGSRRRPEAWLGR